MKAILFCRVSSRDQEETGYSLPAQVKLLSEYSLRKGFDVAKIFDIAESASGKKQRKIFNEMLAFADKEKIDIIICEKVDRLTRNMKDAGIVDEWVKADKKREVHFVKENFVLNQNTKAHENLVWDMKVAIARFYANNLSEEVKKGLNEKANQQWYPGSHKRGYKTIGETKHKTWVIDDSPESMAPFIKKAFELYANNVGYSPKENKRGDVQ